jgi:hypothetical protein
VEKSEHHPNTQLFFWKFQKVNVKKKVKKRKFTNIQGIMDNKKQAIHDALDICSTTTPNTQPFFYSFT